MKKVKALLFFGCIVASLCFISCEDEDVGVCAGCPADTPWSVFGSKNCYSTLNDCEAAEKGDCVICD